MLTVAPQSSAAMSLKALGQPKEINKQPYLDISAPKTHIVAQL